MRFSCKLSLAIMAYKVVIFLNRLKELRKEKSLTLDAIAQETGVKRGTYNNYENGKTNPKPETWERLANFFNVPIPYLQGFGWSQDTAINALAVIYSSYQGDVINPKFDYDYNCSNGKVFKIKKDIVKKLADSASIILLVAYDKGLSDNYNSDSDLLVKGGPLSGVPYIKSFSKKDRETINLALENDSENIDVYHLLNAVFSVDERKSLSRFTLEYTSKYEAANIWEDDSEYKEYMTTFKDIAIKRIPALNDFSFLSSIETTQRENGIYGGYELAQRIQEDMQNSLSQETPKDKQELINRLAAIKDNDVKAGLLALYDSLSGKIDKLNDRVDTLEKRLSDSKVHNQPGSE